MGCNKSGTKGEVYYIKKEGKFQISNLTSHLKELEKEKKKVRNLK